MKEIAVGPIILDIAGLTLTEEDKEILLHPNVGGIIFFSRNYDCREQLADLAKHIKAIRPNCLLCVDQEGGRVQRFKAELTKLPPLRSLGDLLDAGKSLDTVKTMSEKLGQLMALEIRSLGVDLSFAPVLDLDKGMSDVIKDRAFHSDPLQVAELAGSYIKGMAQAGMKATGKHFPGHGSVKLDSHLTLPEDPRSFTDLQPDMSPFKALIEKLGAIMPAHIVYPKISPLPVGFCSYWLKNILRQQLKFTGVIVSDDLSMEGASGIGNYAERTQKALEAGCDYVLVCNNRKGAIAALESTQSMTDELQQLRRLSLFGKGNIPSWQELTRSPLWQSALALAVLDENSYPM